MNFTPTPRTSGRMTIVAKFVSKELDDVDGFVNLMVTDNKESSNNNGRSNAVNTTT